MKKSVFALVGQPKNFQISYRPGYQPLHTHYILSNSQHPLNIIYKRKANECRKEGLWWHVTTGVDLSPSSLVRAWARRRLRNAFTEELKARGFDKNGLHTEARGVQRKTNLKDAPEQGNSVDLKGSLRMHVKSPLIPAKYVELKAEAGKIIDTILEDMKSGNRGIKGKR